MRGSRECARDWRGAEGGSGGEAAGTEPPQSPAPLARAGGAQKITRENHGETGKGNVRGEYEIRENYSDFLMTGRVFCPIMGAARFKK